MDGFAGVVAAVLLVAALAVFCGTDLPPSPLRAVASFGGASPRFGRNLAVLGGVAGFVAGPSGSARFRQRWRLHGGSVAAGLKTYFKMLEVRYKLQYEKTHFTFLHYNHRGRTVSQLIVAYLKYKPASQGSQPSTPSSSSGMRSAAARLLGTGNGSEALSFGGGNGASHAVVGSSRIGAGLGTSTCLGGSLGNGKL